MLILIGLQIPMEMRLHLSIGKSEHSVKNSMEDSPKIDSMALLSRHCDCLKRREQKSTSTVGNIHTHSNVPIIPDMCYQQIPVGRITEMDTPSSLVVVQIVAIIPVRRA